MFFELGEGVFTVIYVGVFLAIVLSIIVVRPRSPRRAASTST
jgi:hypothetical protein